MRGCLDRAEKLLNLAFNKCRRFTFGPRKWPKVLLAAKTYANDP